MEIIIKPNSAEAQQEAAKILRRQIQRKPDSVLGLATGSTPIPVYEALVKMHERGDLDFSRIVTFNLDEYVGLAPDHPCSYLEFMRQHLFSRVNLAPGSIHFPNGLAKDIPAHCAEYEVAITRAGGI